MEQTFEIQPFDTRLMEQLNRLLPPEWSSNAYDVFMYNEWQPWFHAFQIKKGDKLVAFGLIIHQGDVAWLGWILVDVKFRKQGYGMAMTRFLVEKSYALGAKTIVLTATELGLPLYEKLGFKTESSYRFFRRGSSPKQRSNHASIFKASKSDLEAISALDLTATGEKRTAMLALHLPATWVQKENETVVGFYVETLGNGLVVAQNEEVGLNLLKQRIRLNDSVVAVPEANLAAIAYMQEQGFTEGSPIPRMVLGAPLSWNPSMIFSRASGYTG
jgi:GNAT superfamily N-acetyltransferase